MSNHLKPATFPTNTSWTSLRHRPAPPLLVRARSSCYFIDVFSFLSSNNAFAVDLAVEIWKSLNYAPNSFDFKANQLYQILQGYTPQVQQVQTLPQRIHYAAFIVSNAMELEHDLLWGPYGYQAMLTRLVLNRPFRDADETVKYMVLPLRYSVAMELKQKATYLLNGVRLSYNSLRSELERLARGLGMSQGLVPAVSGKS